jgi:hypothetical protein
MEIHMKSILLALLVAVPCYAVTDNPDGSVTFTQEEAKNLLENFQQMESDQQRAVLIFKRMQNEIDRLEKEKKEMKCS